MMGITPRMAQSPFVMAVRVYHTDISRWDFDQAREPETLTGHPASQRLPDHLGELVAAVGFCQEHDAVIELAWWTMALSV